MQDDVEQRAVYLQTAVVLDESQFPEAVHEEADAGAGSPHHFGERFLADLGHQGFRLSLFAVAREQQKHPRQPLLAGVEELIYQVFFVADIAGQQVADKQIGKPALSDWEACRAIMPNQSLGNCSLLNSFRFCDGVVFYSAHLSATD